ncbi:hypothetical protein POM88_028919 [Heracleum sosnowskyi]|uniref:Reverse transcriptase zinc-binding domain-containing protein n=1 Tax=Heracleum sosnowskyi TaxID=360622 RepID=A0AAD8HT51_9APIA|nr:hypothetical protein POM88_028919 [Heracleum sosnowskyi]
MISEEEKIWLDREITLEEIEFALSNSANEKAPGPDGFNIGCIKTFWNYLKTDLLNCYKDFSESLPFPAGLNSSFISLIPKKDSPEYVTDFRPISLINSTAKLFTKVLALRLGEVLGNSVNGTGNGSRKEIKDGIYKLIWLPVDGSYTAANSYEFLANESDDTKVEWNFIWKYRIPRKVQIVLWKFFKKILPTSSFLAGRIGPRFAGSRVCKWCNRDEETQMHLFWKCEVAQWAWNFVSTWWKIKIKSGDAGKSSLNFKGPSTRMAWEITWSATLWTIWLCRNQMLFQQVRIKQNELQFLITQRSQLWCQAAKLIDDGILWKSNPIGMVLSASNSKLNFLSNVNAGLIGFIDGSWKILNENKTQGGIGGYLKDSKGNLIFVFSGPVDASSAFDCKYQAMCFLISKIVANHWRGKPCVIYSDSVELVEEVQKWKFSFEQNEDESFKEFIIHSKLEFKKVDRVLNWEADNLARKGAARRKMHCSWC